MFGKSEFNLFSWVLDDGDGSGGVERCFSVSVGTFLTPFSAPIIIKHWKMTKISSMGTWRMNWNEKYIDRRIDENMFMFVNRIVEFWGLVRFECFESYLLDRKIYFIHESKENRWRNYVLYSNAVVSSIICVQFITVHKIVPIEFLLVDRFSLLRKFITSVHKINCTLVA